MFKAFFGWVRRGMRDAFLGGFGDAIEILASGEVSVGDSLGDLNRRLAELSGQPVVANGQAPEKALAAEGPVKPGRKAKA
jgi:hypothetical protein